MHWLNKLKQGFHKTAHLFNDLSLDMEKLEEVLICSDMGLPVVTEILKQVQSKNPKEKSDLYRLLKDFLIQKMTPVARSLSLEGQCPKVILMVGVNGAGKTTTIGKLATSFKGKKIAFVAGDTFRAGAVEQLKKWANQTGADFYSGPEHCDAAGLIFDALKKCQDRHTDIVFIDTAGRLQNRTDLMDELKKIRRVIQKVDVEMPHETILVLDATVGQNALSQVQTFNTVCPLSGLIMTKLDGTAKGGILVSLADQFSLPIYAIGVGESETDLNPFTAEDYVHSILGE